MITRQGSNIVSSLSGEDVKNIPEVVEADLPESEQLILKEWEGEVDEDLVESKAYRN